eukprot:TRINITY_DN9711_c0_g1_i2.p1 TRINITY_DN9711_c0_g1~~TRINITY_DN9711_c0_g1_i2.p1  ORF type:complete len:241 (+),score=59.14 TRINITY_DN9711_c0_g1_i2:54-725(+)
MIAASSRIESRFQHVIKSLSIPSPNSKEGSSRKNSKPYTSDMVPESDRIITVVAQPESQQAKNAQQTESEMGLPMSQPLIPAATSSSWPRVRLNVPVLDPLQILLICSEHQLLLKKGTSEVCEKQRHMSSQMLKAEGLIARSNYILAAHLRDVSYIETQLREVDRIGKSIQAAKMNLVNVILSLDRLTQFIELDDVPGLADFIETQKERYPRATIQQSEGGDK